MTFLCDRCGRSIDIEANIYYTVMQSRTGKQEVICEVCHADLFKFKKVDHALREIAEKHEINKLKRKKGE